MLLPRMPVMPALMMANLHTKVLPMIETRSWYINPLVRAEINAAADRQRTSKTFKGKQARRKAATWAKNNPTRFINAVERYGVVIVNCYTRSLPDAQ